MYSKHKTSKRRLRVYKNRIKHSTCRKFRKNKYLCKRKRSCKFVSGKKLKYCRKRTNEHVKFK